MNLAEYLKRINFEEEIGVNEKTLTALHKHHVLSIAFEDLDVHLKRPIILEVSSLYKKVILKKRGGFCYELNYLFYHLLKQIGFDCKMISSRIYNEDNVLGPEFDHMSILVKLAEDWLVDVGYGDLFIEPIKIADNYQKKDWFKFYRIDKVDNENYLLSESRTGEAFKKRYSFGITSREIEAFRDQCDFKQYSKDSYFVKNKICTLPTIKGRITLFNDKLIRRVGDLKEVFGIPTEEKFMEVLKREFGMVV